MCYRGWSIEFYIRVRYVDLSTGDGDIIFMDIEFWQKLNSAIFIDTNRSRVRSGKRTPSFIFEVSVLMKTDIGV